MKWEYQFIQSANLSDAGLVDKFDELGEEGWELASVVSTSSVQQPEICVFKKPYETKKSKKSKEKK